MFGDFRILRIISIVKSIFNIMSLRTASVKDRSSDDEEAQPAVDRGVVDPYYADAEDPLEENEVFKKTHEGMDFRTVGWPRASVIFLKGMIVLESLGY